MNSLDQRILETRTGEITVLAAPGRKVEVRQLRHEFRFGTAVSSAIFSPGFDPHSSKNYESLLLENFNSIAPENAMKWTSVEPRRGIESWEIMDRIAEFATQHGLSIRGHCIFWNVATHLQPWVHVLSDNELAMSMERRLRSVLGRFKSKILEYDLNNEMTHPNPELTARLGLDRIGRLFKLAREIDPEARLYLNEDFELDSERGIIRYSELISRLLAMGAPVGGIGLQSHYRTVPSQEFLVHELETFANFGLPISITEFDVLKGTPEEKAQGLERALKVAFAQPAVAGFWLWGFWEGAHWRPSAALWKKDFSPTPSADTWRRLIFHDWWTLKKGNVDSRGEFKTRAFFGRYEVKAGSNSRLVELKRSKGSIVVDFRTVSGAKVMHKAHSGSKRQSSGASSD